MGTRGCSEAGGGSVPSSEALGLPLCCSLEKDPIVFSEKTRQERVYQTFLEFLPTESGIPEGASLEGDCWRSSTLPEKPQRILALGRQGGTYSFTAFQRTRCFQLPIFLRTIYPREEFGNGPLSSSHGILGKACLVSKGCKSPAYDCDLLNKTDAQGCPVGDE